jgi:hypothetical protein
MGMSIPKVVPLRFWFPSLLNATLAVPVSEDTDVITSGEDPFGDFGRSLSLPREVWVVLREFLLSTEGESEFTEGDSLSDNS